MKVFIIGCGFTKAVFPDAPLNGELLHVLANADGGSAAGELLRKYKLPDIEIALTQLDLDIAKAGTSDSNGLSDLRKRIVRELGDYFRKYCASQELLKEKPWLNDLISQGFNPGDVAISLNYDCLLEGALDCLGKWTPNGGYGASIDPPHCGTTYPPSQIAVLKLHGSASFQKSEVSGKPDCCDVGLQFDECFFPCSAQGKHFGLADGVTYVIAPSYVKVPSLEIAYLMVDAIKATANAENLVVIGCSLRQEDAFLRVLLANFGRQGPKSRKIIIVDPEAKGIAKNIDKYWPAYVKDKIVPICDPIETSVAGLLVSISNSTH
jgi:hypothetical protein